MKPLLILFFLTVVVACVLLYVFRPSGIRTIPNWPLEIIPPEKNLPLERLHAKASAIRSFISVKTFLTNMFF
jgi:hypothetical protein